MLGLSRLDGKPPTGHLAQTSNARPYTKRTLSAELNGDKPERLVSRWHQGEFCPTEDVGRNRNKLWFRIYSPRVALHRLLEFKCSEFTVIVDGGSETDELHILVLVQDSREDIRDQINPLLQGPTADKYEELGLFGRSVSTVGTG